MSFCDPAGRGGNTAKRRGNGLGSTSSGTSASAPGLPPPPPCPHAPPCTLARPSPAAATAARRTGPPGMTLRPVPALSVIWRDEREHGEGGAVAVGRRAHGSWGSRSRPLHVLLDLDILRTAHPLEGSLRARCGSVIWSGRGRAEGVAGSRPLTPGGPRVLADPARTARPAVGFALGRRERRVDAVEHARAGGAGDCVSACMSSGRVCVLQRCLYRTGPPGASGRASVHVVFM